MSKLYHTETGNVIPTLCEELTDYRRARKVLQLPGTGGVATLFVLARAYPGCDLPLRLAVNGTELPGVRPDSRGGPALWYAVPIEPRHVKPGANVVEFWSDAPAMNAWSLAIEPGHAQPDSWVSTDAGQTWRNEKMGYLNVVRGEYIVRIRLAEGQDPVPPVMVWEAPRHPRLHRLRELVPAQAVRSGPVLERVRALTTWVSSSWEYRHQGTASQYAPWDAETIIAWGQSKQGHDGRLPIVMCVHYAVTLVTCCMAVGIPARCAAFTGGIGGMNGHFTAEVWFDDLGKWVMVDPMQDAVLFKGGLPLSVEEIQQAGGEVADLIQWGPGYQMQCENPVVRAFVQNNFSRGVCFEHRSIWPRTDFLSHPELTPSCHGSIAYCETGFVWERRDMERGFGMFPYFGDEEYFQAPPSVLAVA